MILKKKQSSKCFGEALKILRCIFCYLTLDYNLIVVIFINHSNLFINHSLLFIIHGFLFIIHGFLFIIRSLLFIIHGIFLISMGSFGTVSFVLAPYFQYRLDIFSGTSKRNLSARVLLVSRGSVLGPTGAGRTSSTQFTVKSAIRLGNTRLSKLTSQLPT